MRQRLACHIPLAVEEMSVKLLRGRVVTDDLETTDIHRSNMPIGGMHHEVSARRPFINVAGDDRGGGLSGRRHRFSFSNPTSDEHVQEIKLRDGRPALHGTSSRHALDSNKRRSLSDAGARTDMSVDD